MVMNRLVGMGLEECFSNVLFIRAFSTGLGTSGVIWESDSRLVVQMIATYGGDC